MDTKIFDGNWKQIQGKLKQNYADLVEDPKLFEEGKEEELLGRLETKLGKTRDEVVNWLKSL